jgi:uncharacterized protein YjbI with pentapeptide repeats
MEASMPCCYQHPDDRACQFGDSESLTNYEGRQYCDWHLPAAAKRDFSEEANREFSRRLYECISKHEAGQMSAHFAGVVFAEKADFAERTLKHADFRGATFLGDADFCSASFIGDANFSSVTFNKYAHFSSAIFKDAADFSSTVLRSHANFSAVKFSGNASWKSACVAKSANFSRSSYSAYVDFESVAFAEKVDFSSAVFDAYALFCSARFGESADFSSATFVHEVHFNASTFNGEANFDAASFASEANFESVEFAGHADFSAPTEATKSIFVRSSWGLAIFRQGVTFNNRIFADAGNFLGAVFHKAPMFYGCTLHQAMMFPMEGHFKDTRWYGAAQAYRTLKLGMATMKARTEEGMFFTLEQRSLRHVALAAYSRNLERWFVSLATWLLSSNRGNRCVMGSNQETVIESMPSMTLMDVVLSWAYDKVSDFGRSGVRPIVLLFVLWALSALVYGANRSAHLNIHAPIDMQVLTNAMVFSVEQIVRPFYVWGPNTKTLFEGDVIPHGVQLFASLQSILSLALLSLSLLAINWRFKRD